MKNKFLYSIVNNLNILFRDIENHIVDILFLIGFTFASIGFFIWNTIIGFIATGIGLMALSYLIFRGGD